MFSTIKATNVSTLHRLIFAADYTKKACFLLMEYIATNTKEDILIVSVKMNNNLFKDFDIMINCSPLEAMKINTYINKNI